MTTVVARNGVTKQPRGTRKAVALCFAIAFASAAFAQSHDLAPADARRIDDLQLRQRLEQQQLEMEQWQRERALERSASVLGENEMRRRLDLQRDAFRVERDLQALRFQLDQNRLTQSLARQPLQPPPAPGTLRLP
jgi:hypothetical protein